MNNQLKNNYFFDINLKSDEDKRFCEDIELNKFNPIKLVVMNKMFFIIFYKIYLQSILIYYYF